MGRTQAATQDLGMRRSQPYKAELSQVQRVMPVILATGKAEIGRICSSPAQAESVRSRFNIGWGLWYMPVIPAMQEAQIGGSRSRLAQA
jgi:hypothetical protein